MKQESAQRLPRTESAGQGRVGAPGEKAPLSRFADVLLRFPKYIRLAWGLLRDERIDRQQKAVLMVGVGYLALPVDLVPGIIPVAGQLDDMAAILLALRSVLRAVPEEVATRHLHEAGLSRADVDRDLASLGVTAGWIVGQGATLALHGLGLAAGTLARGVGNSWRALGGNRAGGGPRRR